MSRTSLIGLVSAASLLASSAALAQSTSPDCDALRLRLAEHARLSDGVRQALRAQVGSAPAPAQAAAPPTVTAPAATRADTVRARLEQIPKERLVLEDQRLAAMVRFELSRATQIQGQIQVLDGEKAVLERELAALPATSSAPMPAAPAPAPRQIGDAERVRCEDAPGTVANAVKIRQRELGAREGQAGVIPLMGFKAHTAEQIARDLAGQFAAWPEAATQVGLLASETTPGSLEGFVDVPAPNVFRVYRQRSDGTLAVEIFVPPGSPTPPAYGEPLRRIEESTVRQPGQTLADLLAARPAGSMRVLAQSAQFVDARTSFLAANFADTAKIETGAARSVDYPNYRGETVRLVETIAPGSSGLVIRRLVVLPRPNSQEQWEETVTQIRPVSFYRTDAEITTSRETRTTAGAPVGTRTTGAPVKLSVER
ncbi:MAG: hypothetical protein ACREQL_13685 [Candidatus Binatia bacterium]